MKKSSLLVVLICISQLISAQTKQQPVVSKIEKVTLYTSGGQVNRTAKASLPAGKTELLFAGISPDIDKQSIQVKGKGKFTILSVNHQVNYLNEQTRREEVDKLDGQRDAIQQKIIQETNTQQVYKNEEAMLLKNQAIGGANTGLKTVDLKEAIDFQRSRLTEVYLKLAEIARNLKRLDSTNTKIILQQRQLISPENYATSEIIVTVQATAAVSADFDVSYFVKKAGWFATYDLNVKDISSPVELSFKANVFQSSGEDWKDVKLTISNGNPTENSIAPVLQPWSLRFGYNPPPGRTNLRRNEIHGRVTDSKDGSPAIGVSVLVKGSNIGTVTDGNGNYTLQIPENAATLKFQGVGFENMETPIRGSVVNSSLKMSTHMLEEVVVTSGFSSFDRADDESRSAGRTKSKKMEEGSLILETVESNRATTVTFEIELPYTILNDGKVYQVDIKTMTVPADYQYFAVPKIDKEAFLTAKIANWQELNLLEGEINLFFEGAFLGKSILDLSNATDTLNISLGRDKSITVERKKLKEFSSRQFLSSNKTDNMAYEITVRNNKPLPINIVIQDQFPVSTTKEITVDEQESSGAQIDSDTRLLTWKYQLESKQEKKHLLKYSVKYPKNQVLVLE